MPKSWYLRLSVLLGLCALSVYLLYPSYVFYFRATEAQRDNGQAFCRMLPGWAHCAKLNLGLDLQGGVHLVMGVRTDKAIAHRLDRTAEGIRDRLREGHIDVAAMQRPRGADFVALVLADAAGRDGAEALIARDFGLVQTRRQDITTLRLSLTDAEAHAVRDSAVEQTIKTIRNRADKLGVT